MTGKYGKALLTGLAVLTLAAGAQACTTMGVGKDASVDGSVMVSHTVDAWYDERIQIIPGGEHKEGEMVEIWGDTCTDNQPARPIRKNGEIPQVAKTYTFFNVGYPFMNEKGVLMGEFTWLGRDECSSPAGIMYIANLQQLGLQRGATAREAVKVMGELAEKYGYCDYGETLVVADGNEGWVFEIIGGGATWKPESGLPGAHWVATRIPDDKMFVGANRSRTGVIDFDDKENVMVSTDITKLPEMMGWWKQGEPFNYQAIFNPEPYGYPFYQTVREWRILSTVNPSGNHQLQEHHVEYPMFVKPDKKMSAQDIMNIYSDHMEGTAYDQTVGLAAGPFGCPNRWPLLHDQKPDDRKNMDWCRVIALPRCSYSFVAQARTDLPDPVKTLLWFGQDAPDTTVYVPLFCGVTKLPKPWVESHRDRFDRDSAWWAFNLVNNWANLRWNAMYPIIRERKASYEKKYFEDKPLVEKKVAELAGKSAEEAVKYLNEYTNKTFNELEKGWWDFAYELIGKFYDGCMIDEHGDLQKLGYSKEYLESVGFADQETKDLEALKK